MNGLPDGTTQEDVDRAAGDLGADDCPCACASRLDWEPMPVESARRRPRSRLIPIDLSMVDFTIVAPF